MRTKKISITIIGFFWLTTTSVAAALPVAISIEKQPDGSHYVMGRFMVEASTRNAWNTLSGYDELSSFVPSMRDSQRIKEDRQKIYVAQTMVGKAGFLRKKVTLLLEITETPPFKIEFRDVSGKSFQLYNGSWEIAQWDNGIAITYQLYATPNFFAPAFITNGVFQRDVRELLENVRDRILLKEQGG